MNEIVEELKKWREARNMQDNEFIVEKEVASMIDECKEVLLAETDEHRAEEYCDIAIFAFNGLGLLREHYDGSFKIEGSCIGVMLESLASMLKVKSGWKIATELNYIIALCEFAVNELGYDFQKMMLEKIKVISSREQDPEQAKEWALSGASGKWEKNKAQSKDTLYKPDFESCRISTNDH